MSRKLVVFFPGRKYGADCPLLYFSDFICRTLGYERYYLHYAAHREEESAGTVEEDIAKAVSYVMEHMKTIDFSLYEEVILISKSIGTVLAGKVQEEFGLHVKNIYFTPLEQTLIYLDEKRKNLPEENLVLAGTRDGFLEADRLMEVCKRAGVPLYQVEGVGHSMETEDVIGSLELLKDLMRQVEVFLSGEKIFPV